MGGAKEGPVGGAKEGPVGGAADEETGGGLREKVEQGTVVAVMVLVGGNTASTEPALVCLGPVEGGTEGPVEGGTEGPGTTDDSTEERRSEAWRLPNWDASSKELERFRLAEGRGGEFVGGFAGGDKDVG